MKARASVITISPGTINGKAVIGGTLMHMIAFDSHKEEKEGGKRVKPILNT